MNEFVMLTMEIIGTIAFAVSGALVAISFSLDIFGVAFLGVITGMLTAYGLGRYAGTPFFDKYEKYVGLTKEKIEEKRFFF